MPEGKRITAIYTPKSVFELTSVIAKDPDVRLFAGGTDLMTQENTGDLVTLSKIPEFTRIQHNDRFIEVGAMITLQQLLPSLPKVLAKAVNEIGSSLVRNQATVGGALCSRYNRSSLSAILSSNQTVAEIKTVTRIGRKEKRYRVISKWIPVSKLYDSDGEFLYSKDSVLTRIRIPMPSQDINQIYRTLGSPMYDKNHCVMFAFQYSISQTGTFTSTSLCCAIPNGGLFYDSDFNNLLTSVSIPISVKQIKKVSEEFEDALVDTCPQFSDLQIEKAKRMLETVLFQANTIYLNK